MPLPQEQAAIDVAVGSRRDRLVKAAAILDRDPAIGALYAFRPPTGFGFHGVALLLFLGLCVSAQWFKPVRVFRCAPQGSGLAQWPSATSCCCPECPWACTVAAAMAAAAIGQMLAF